MKLSITNDVITLEPTHMDDLKQLKRLCAKEGDSIALVRGPETTEQGKFILQSVAKAKTASKKDVLKASPKKEG
jgi:phage protein U